MFLDVLQSQNSLYQTQRDLVDSQAKLAVDLVALYKALGGGWQNQLNTNKDALPKSWAKNLVTRKFHYRQDFQSDAYSKYVSPILSPHHLYP